MARLQISEYSVARIIYVFNVDTFTSQVGVKRIVLQPLHRFLLLQF
jgi:hypothetical protein